MSRKLYRRRNPDAGESTFVFLTSAASGGWVGSYGTHGMDMNQKVILGLLTGIATGAVFSRGKFLEGAVLGAMGSAVGMTVMFWQALQSDLSQL